MFGGGFGVIAGRLFRRVSVNLRAYSVDMVGYFESGTLFRSFEHSMLYKVGYAVFFRRFVRAARFYEYSARDGNETGHIRDDKP